MMYIYKNLFQTATTQISHGKMNFLLKQAYSTSKSSFVLAKTPGKVNTSLGMVMRQFGRSTKNSGGGGKPKIKVNEIRRLLSLAKPYKLKIALAMGFLLISSAVTMLVPFGIGKLIDFIQSGDRESMKEKLKSISLVMLGVFIIGALANFGRVYIIQSTGQQIVMKLRQRLFKSMMNQEVAFFDKNKTGELINRLSSDSEVVGLSISQNLSDGLRSSIQAAGGIGMMFYVSPYLAAVGLSIVPAVTFFAIGFGRYIKELSKKVQDTLADATQVAEEKISNIRTVRAFAQEEKETALYTKSINKVMDMKFKEAIAYAGFYGTTGFSGNFIILSVFYFGGGSIAENLITIGDLSAFLIYSAWVGISIGGLSSFYSELMRGIGASTRIWEIIDREPAIPIISETERLMSKEILNGDIQFNDISFAYPTRKEQNILTNLDLTIPGGKVLAVVGPSGSGKSTLASLLLRFYDPITGSVSIGGQNINDMPQTWLRNNIGSVPQEPVLFSMSIKDNIAYGCPNPDTITNEQIYSAASEANAFSFINNFPDKFDTIIGERGVNISGGQKQRIAIARAILRNPQILLLDEATSALDASSEYLVQEALEKIMKNRTVVIIAHRLSTIKNADMIAVLDKGRVMELGTYQTLMQNTNGQFKELVTHQTVVESDYEV